MFSNYNKLRGLSCLPGIGFKKKKTLFVLKYHMSETWRKINFYFLFFFFYKYMCLDSDTNVNKNNIISQKVSSCSKMFINILLRYYISLIWKSSLSFKNFISKCKKCHFFIEFVDILRPCHNIRIIKVHTETRKSFHFFSFSILLL